MTVTITPTLLKGTITPPPSKSQAHRLLIAAALAEGESVLSNVAFSQDILATLHCMEQLGARWTRTEEAAVRMIGIGGRTAHAAGEPLPHFDCGESGSTLRFLIPIALAVAGGGVFTGRGRLMERPQKPYFDLFDRMGIHYALENEFLTVTGRLVPGTYELPGDVSSQFVTGLLYALSLLEGESDIMLTSTLESKGYAAMTRDAQRQFGVETKSDMNHYFHIPGGQRYQPRSAAVEADWSQAGFWYAAAGVGNAVTVTGMNPHSIQGDRSILAWGRMLRNEPLTGGVTVPIVGTASTAVPPEKFSQPDLSQGCSVSIDVSNSPDLVPPLAAWGALMNGTLILKNAGRLRIKESDRLSAITQVLTAMGAQVEEHPDSLTIVGLTELSGGVTVDSHNDHRIAMMAAVAATRCKAPVTILNAQCVAKSYPTFWEDYVNLGGQIFKEDV